MKNILMFAAFFGLFFVVSCDKDDDTDPAIDYQYSIEIDSPNDEDKHIGDTIHVVVNFESQTMETIHHINVRLYNKADETEIFSEPQDAHVHIQEGALEFTISDVVLSNANGFTEHTDWVVEAKVWAEEEGEGEVVETVEFHLHP